MPRLSKRSKTEIIIETRAKNGLDVETYDINPKKEHLASKVSLICKIFILCDFTYFE